MVDGTSGALEQAPVANLPVEQLPVVPQAAFAPVQAPIVAQESTAAIGLGVKQISLPTLKLYSFPKPAPAPMPYPVMPAGYPQMGAMMYPGMYPSAMPGALPTMAPQAPASTSVDAATLALLLQTMKAQQAAQQAPPADPSGLTR